jgi:hypothetical protein
METNSTDFEINKAMIGEAEALANEMSELMDGKRVLVAMIAIGAILGRIKNVAECDIDEMIGALRKQIVGQDFGESIESAYAAGTLN